jgi:glycerate dehydrogenase
MMIKKNIVVLDGYTLNPGDLDWSELRSLGLCTIHNRTLPDEIIHRANETEIVLTNKTVLSKEILEQLPRLRYIGVLATGYNVVDIAAAKKMNITVTNVPAYSTHSVAQTVFALLLELTHHAGHHSAEVRNGRWSANPDFSFWDFPLVELRGKTFGIVGYGNIGQAVARIAAAFEMNVVISTRTARTSGDSFTDTETLLKTSDIVSLHCSLNDETQNLINAKRLAIMKPSAYLINTGRGGLIDEYALANALNNELLAGAGLDVLSIEPPKDNPLLSAKNCIVTPHIAWASRSARERLMDAVVHNVQSFIEGKPVNVVS